MFVMYFSIVGNTLYWSNIKDPGTCAWWKLDLYTFGLESLWILFHCAMKIEKIIENISIQNLSLHHNQTASASYSQLLTLMKWIISLCKLFSELFTIVISKYILIFFCQKNIYMIIFFLHRYPISFQISIISHFVFNNGDR